ncbi:MAG: hypothetical protein LKJ25_05110 [Clostridia bacterium]|jgi:hypothetical protein|nr:hypothetical protein [Clostridia bacterium]
MIKKYIYNPQQAKYYIEHGVLPLDVDIHYRTHRKFWVFDTEATAEVYDMWCEKCKEYRRNKKG